MSQRLIQLLLLLGFCIINSFEWNFIFNLDDEDKLLCYSCKGNDCEKTTNNDENKIICNKKTQLCWAGFIDQQPYRTCANRYCTPSDISLDNDIHIETCCRSNLCNSISLSGLTIGKSNKKITSSPRSETSAVVIQTTTNITIIKKNTTLSPVNIVDQIVDEKPSDSGDKDIYGSEEEQKQLAARSKLQLNASNPDSFGINWDRIPYDTDFGVRVASISSVLLFLMPLILVLLI